MTIARACCAAILLCASGNQARSQTPDGSAGEAAPFGSPIADDEVWMHVTLDQLEARAGRRNSFRWEGEAWLGTDTDRLWIRIEGEAQSGRVSDGQQEIFYDTPISPYFDLQAGARYDLDSRPGRAWAALGIEGLSQYFFRISATAYVGSAGHYAAKLLASYDLLITQRLILQPEAEADFYTRSDPRRLTGSGISGIDAGLRLRYEFDRKLAPYLGITWQNALGETARLARAGGEKPDALRVAVGLRSWF